ncbi:unnamed protein product, partial [Mesorhabditis belari]|uniref:Uncharacterized protein n=1 Tax=Mesorhabditis belari TaxID=2138241 RepID=A0AAF3FIV6_9BILA
MDNAGFLLGQFPNDLDGVVTCEIPRLKEICDARYEPKQCRVILPDAKVLEIPPIENTDAKGLYLNGVDAIAWSYTYGQNGTGLEYTINSLGLYSDSDKVYLLDIVGSALQDLCERKIRIPVDQRDWGAWATFKRRKLYRFMKAQAAGFVTADRETFDFIIQSIMKTWETQRHDFKRFFCHHYLDGQYLLPEDLCIHPQLTNAKINKMQKYISALKSDLDLEFFQTKLKRAIEEMYNRKK